MAKNLQTESFGLTQITEDLYIMMSPWPRLAIQIDLLNSKKQYWSWRIKTEFLQLISMIWLISV